MNWFGQWVRKCKIDNRPHTIGNLAISLGRLSRWIFFSSLSHMRLVKFSVAMWYLSYIKLNWVVNSRKWKKIASVAGESNSVAKVAIIDFSQKAALNWLEDCMQRIDEMHLICACNDLLVVVGFWSSESWWWSSEKCTFLQWNHIEAGINCFLSWVMRSTIICLLKSD